nr:DUF1707 domain-containing protein [Mycolicibacterium sp. CBMA 226]
MHHHEEFQFPESMRNSAGGGTATDTLGDHIRVGDAERDVVSRRLTRAVTDGRLTLTEYDTRLQQLYQAETRGALAEIVADLPRSDANRESKRQRRQAIPAWVVIMWMPWAAVNILCLSVWLATGGGYFWPFWVAVPWGCALLIPTAIGILTGRGHQREGGVRANPPHCTPPQRFDGGVRACTAR